MSDQQPDEVVTAPEVSDIEDVTGDEVVVETETTDDNGDLDLGPDDHDQGAPDVATPESEAGKVGAIADEKDRTIPEVAETKLHDAQGKAFDRTDMAAYVWARAYHNLPGFVQANGVGLVAARYEELDPETGKGVGDPVNVDESDGWIPNNEEGVHAVELGFAELIETPADAPAPPE